MKAWTALSTQFSKCCNTSTISLLLLLGTTALTALICGNDRAQRVRETIFMTINLLQVTQHSPSIHTQGIYHRNYVCYVTQHRTLSRIHSLQMCQYKCLESFILANILAAPAQIFKINNCVRTWDLTSLQSTVNMRKKNMITLQN